MLKGYTVSILYDSNNSYILPNSRVWTLLAKLVLDNITVAFFFLFVWVRLKNSYDVGNGIRSKFVLRKIFSSYCSFNLTAEGNNCRLEGWLKIFNVTPSTLICQL